MTPLEAALHRRIALDGPLSIADYMALCLGHPEHGYYQAREPFGAGGDFVTAPEVSQMFGELLGLWAAETWRRMGSPDPVRLIELGPGRGTLMRDALRAARLLPGFVEAAAVHLVESSRRLAEAQKATLDDVPAAMTWHRSFGEVPEGPTILLANEFFDALPVRQFVRATRGFHERLVGLDAEERLAFGLSPAALPPEAMPEPLRRAPEGAVVETSPASMQLMAGIAARVASCGGAALVIDYGHARSAPGDTFQAVRGHAYADPLVEPGFADLTAHVDFEALGRAAREAGAVPLSPVTQGDFLKALGIEHRAERLARTVGPEGADAIASQLRRLVDPAEMGSLFKV
ncbi:MAG: class I SAM-dependent methyltransferase, partial [Pseudomonadota bacterium]|nr:class I SAM-dependent methyltransferase [Pseudomonadota bacterium]